MLSKIKNSFTKFPDRNSFFIGGTGYSYSELEARVCKIMSAIRENKNDQGRNIGILTYDDLETYASVLAILFSGLTFVPILPGNPVDRNKLIIDQAEIKLLLSSRKSEDSVTKFPKEISFIYTSALNSTIENTIIKVPDYKDDDHAYLLFTSGTTGIPKGVPITCKNLDSFIDAFFSLGYKIDEHDKFLQMFDLSFDLSLMSYLAPLCIGACVYTIPVEGIKYMLIYELFENHEITFALMVPSILTYLRPFFPEIKLEKMKYSLFCGEALLQDVTSEWAECIPNAVIQNVYGPTEATIFCLAYNCSIAGSSIKAYNGIVSIGKPMKNMKSIVIDENNKPVSNGDKGELCLAGFQLTPGYWKNPGKNKEAFIKVSLNGKEEVFYKTGDISFIDNDGDFMFAGRVDQQVKIQGGFRVELSEIEHYAREFLQTNNAAAIAHQHATGITQIHLFIENYRGDFSALNDYLKNKLPDYMIPSKIINEDIFPLNVNGKIDRKALAAKLKTENGI